MNMCQLLDHGGRVVAIHGSKTRVGSAVVVAAVIFVTTYSWPNRDNSKVAVSTSLSAKGNMNVQTNVAGSSSNR